MRRNGTQTSDGDDDEDEQRHRDPGDGLEPGGLAVVEQAVGLGEVDAAVGQRPGEVDVDLAARLRADEEREADGDGAGGERGDDRLDAGRRRRCRPLMRPKAVPAASVRRRSRGRSAPGVPLTSSQAMQLASVITAPTERSRPPSSTGTVCAMATKRERDGLVGVLR